MDDLRYDDTYRCGYCQGRVYLSGHTTLHYRCAGCGLAPVALIQPNVEEVYREVTLSGSEIALLYSAALRQRNEYDWYSVVIRTKWEAIIKKLSDVLEADRREE
jgi:hypothetical protein